MHWLKRCQYTKCGLVLFLEKKKNLRFEEIYGYVWILRILTPKAAKTSLLCLILFYNDLFLFSNFFLLLFFCFYDFFLVFRTHFIFFVVIFRYFLFSFVLFFCCCCRRCLLLYFYCSLQLFLLKICLRL